MRTPTVYNIESKLSRVVTAQVQMVRIGEADEGQRLDNYLAKCLKGAPRSHLQRIIRSGEVRVNGARAAFDTRLSLGQMVRIPPIRLAAKTQEALQQRTLEPKVVSHKNKPNPFEVLFEDEHILIINKPSGIAVHGGSGVAFGVIEQLRQCAISSFLELAHRIDRDTSGILVVAKRRPALVKLQAQLRDSVWKKHYQCVVFGSPEFVQCDIKLPLLRTESPTGERWVVVDQDHGQFALSRLRVIRKAAHVAELRVRIMTGRTHQIRVHCASIGLPLLGDAKYGDFELNKTYKAHKLRRLMLHAHSLEFPHPVTGQQLLIQAPLPDDYLNCTRHLFEGQ